MRNPAAILNMNKSVQQRELFDVFSPFQFNENNAMDYSTMIVKQSMTKQIFMSRIKELAKVNKIFTHAGKFHADEVFAIALIRVLLANTIWMPTHQVEIIRVGNTSSISEADLESSIVLDIGGGLLDHHNKETILCRENGIEYAAFGRCGLYYLRPFLYTLINDVDAAEEAYQTIDKQLIQYIDANDTMTMAEDGSIQSYNPINTIIGSMMPKWNENFDSINDKFNAAIAWAQTAISTLLDKVIADSNLKVVAEKVIKNNTNDKYIVLDTYMPIERFLAREGIMFMLYPSIRNAGNWCSKSIPNTVDDTQLLFPEEFVTNEEKEISIDSKVSAYKASTTISFCHPKRFILEATSKENAIKATEIALVLFDEGNSNTPNFDRIAEEYAKKCIFGVVTLDKYYPIEDKLYQYNKDIKMMVYPEPDSDNWVVQGIRNSVGEFLCSIPLNIFEGKQSYPLQSELGHNIPLSIVSIDRDNFKIVCDGKFDSDMVTLAIKDNLRTHLKK